MLACITNRKCSPVLWIRCKTPFSIMLNAEETYSARMRSGDWRERDGARSKSCEYEVKEVWSLSFGSFDRVQWLDKSNRCEGEAQKQRQPPVGFTGKARRAAGIQSSSQSPSSSSVRKLDVARPLRTEKWSCRALSILFCGDLCEIFARFCEIFARSFWEIFAT